MLADEVKQAMDNHEEYSFTHLLIVSRVYHLSEEEEVSLASSAATRRTGHPNSAGSPKKTKRMKQLDGRGQAVVRPPDGLYAFHPEDIILAKYASHSVVYPYRSPLPSLVEEKRTQDSFGLDIRGRMFLIEGGEEKLRGMGESMAELFGTGSS